MINTYVRSDNNKYIINLIGPRLSFRCKQRSLGGNLKFVSFKTTQREIKKNKILIGPLQFNTIF